MKHNFFLFIFTSWILCSCYKDKGNYDYQQINETSINNIDSAYTVFIGDSLHIHPQLSFSKDPAGTDSAYEYEWWGISSASRFQQVSLGVSRNLDIKFGLPSGIYDVYYRVTSKSTGIQAQQKFRITAQTIISEGYLLLCDNNGKSRLDMLSYSQNDFRYLPNVLNTVESKLPEQGKPINIYCYPYQPTVYGIYLMTETGTNRIDPESFDYNATYNISYEFLSKLPANFAPQNISSGGNWAWLYENGNIYNYFRAANIYYGLPLNIYQGEVNTFRTSPFIAATSINAILYDEDHKRFVKSNIQQSYCTQLPTGTMFNFTTGKDLLYMNYNRYTGGVICAVLEDKPSGKRYIGRFTMAGVQNYYAEITATDIMQAENFAFSPDLGFMYYNVGSKVYQYNLSTKISHLVLDKGQPITVLKFHTFFYEASASKTNTYKVWAPKLLICSYDPGLPSAVCGSMDMLTVLPVTGDLTPFLSFEGLGKVVSLSYRERI
ncbi:PKD-like family lipoprotein [Chitinophaga sp. sic0106]|uniref:PKD-like family lipoprotein n=1 Tax=Chitinophaga sp. sic0106 TaxID=2854785 RepID=UPI001C43887B|nr:PKD-like family lipoprotein [Chitinophaga sp. sic0106]MBV7533257.1 hypothetical protein [Chitinophaga sp. sic0106]